MKYNEKISDLGNAKLEHALSHLPRSEGEKDQAQGTINSFALIRLFVQHNIYMLQPE
jgi:hypothetical protein